MGSDSKKGFGALGRDEMLWFDPAHLVLVEDKSHPLYDERIHLPLDEALVRNVMMKGILEPVIVRKNGERDGVPIVEVVDGRQRVRAAREANARLAAEGKVTVRVPGIRTRGDDGHLLGVMVSTNEHRQADSVVVKARKLSRFIQMGRSREEAAVIFGVSEATVKNWTTLVDCSDEVVSAVESGRLTMVSALKLSNLSREKQAIAVVRILESGSSRGDDGIKLAAKEAGKPRAMSRSRVEALKSAIASMNRVDRPDSLSVIKAILGEENHVSRMVPGRRDK